MNESRFFHIFAHILMFNFYNPKERGRKREIKKYNEQNMMLIVS